MKQRIGILGIGGVGGYVGGKLAESYHKSEQVEIIFIARGEHAQVIREKGLTIQNDETTFVVYPDLVSDDPEMIGELTVLICATKGYDLKQSLTKYASCITPTTIFLPLLNGVSAPAIIRSVFPAVQLVEGCIFIVSKIVESGKIQIDGKNHIVYFGGNEPFVDQLEQIFSPTSIQFKRVEDVQQAIWEKFIFIASLATLTTFTNQTIGQILDDESKTEQLKALMQEVYTLACAQHITIIPTYLEKNFKALHKMPYETTASMHRDVLAGKNCEYEALTVYVSALAQQYSVSTPLFDQISEVFKQRFS